MQLTNEWISGFVDGEGCFNIQKIKKKEKESRLILASQQPLVIEDEKPFLGEKTILRHRFIVSQDKRSTGVLYGLKRKFKCGTVHKAGGNMMAFQVSKSIHLEKIIIPFFQKYTLKTTKRESFRLFVESMKKYNKGKTRERETISLAFGQTVPDISLSDVPLAFGQTVTFEESDRFTSRKVGLRPNCKGHKIVDKQRQKESYPDISNKTSFCLRRCDALFDTEHKVSTFALQDRFTYNFSDNWFCGFIDATGCFSVSLVKDYLRPQLVIGLQSKEKEMLVELQKFLKCGTLRTRKDGAEILQVVSSIDLERYIFPKLQRKGGAILLQSSKRISYQKFRKIVRLIVEKKHHTIEGLEKIKKYKTTLTSLLTLPSEVSDVKQRK